MREDFGEPVNTLLDLQQGVIARYQLKDAAVLACIRRRVSARRWQAAYRGVYVDHNGNLTRAQRRWAVLLAAGPEAAWTGPTVLQLHGIRGWASAAVHVAVPHTHHGPAIAGGVVLRLRRLDCYLHGSRSPRQLRLPVAVLHTAAAAKSAADANAIVSGCVQQGKVSTVQLRTELQSLPRLPRRALIAECLLDVEGGAHSMNEIAFRQLVRRAGLPEPVLQIEVATPGRRARLDGGWPEAGIWFEIDGELHREAAAWINDLDRSNELAIAQGGTRLRWSGFMVRREPERVLDQLRRAFDREGDIPAYQPLGLPRPGSPG